jgi:membrane protein DedA with SNARE-associated domain
MDLYELIEQTVKLLRCHEQWVIPLVMLLAFGESLVMVALLIPATVLLLAIGALIGYGGLNFWPVWSAAALGAILGDWLSYWLGYHYSQVIIRRWPLRRYPKLLSGSVDFFKRRGISGVCIGRFFGPLRALIPFAAGVCRMEQRSFQLANIASGCLWAWLLLAPGAFGIPWLERYFPQWFNA